MTEKTMTNCLRYRGKLKCDFTGKECNNETVKTCKEYKSDEGFIKPFGVGLRSLLVDKTEAVWKLSNAFILIIGEI